MKRCITLLLVAALAAASTACGAQPAQSDVTSADTTATDAVTEDPLADGLPAKNFGGVEFRISSMSKYASEMDVDELNGDICNDAVYNRNRSIEDRFNVKIVNNVCEFADNSTHANYITKTVLAGEDAFDLAGLFTYKAGPLVMQGLFRNWNEIPYVDFTKPWWVNGCTDAFSVGDKLYVAVGDLSVTTMLLSYGVFFNKRIAGDYNLNNLYDTVRDGKWTIDYLSSVSKDVYSDLNGNNTADDGDLFGFSGEKVTNLDVYPAAFNIKLISKSKDNKPVLDINTDRMQTALEKVYSLYYDNIGSWIPSKDGEEIQTFADGRVLFLTSWMNNAFTTFRKMADDYGILPYPKLDEKQAEYYTNSMDNYSFQCVPQTAENLEMIGIITEALNAESMKTVMPAYYDTALSTKYTRDEESIEMLGIIMAGRNYDFAILHNSELEKLPYIFRNLIAASSTDFASTFASVQVKIESGLEKIIETYENLN